MAAGLRRRPRIPTLVHLKLEAHRINVETKAIVPITYPYLGMGIGFFRNVRAGGWTPPRHYLRPRHHGVRQRFFPSHLRTARFPYFRSRGSHPGAHRVPGIRHLLTGEDFLLVLRKGQVGQSKLAK
jgi:hypothetical protein